MRNQKKIAKRKAPGGFSKVMLDRHIIIGKRIKGVSEACDYRLWERENTNWILKHREYLKVITEEQTQGKDPNGIPRF